jgi:endonuclease/exonuclease/phosphatase family metal-dependent hydrolase
VTAHENRKSTFKVMTALFGAAGTRDGEFGNAVLSRLPMRGSHRHRLSDAATGNEPRGGVWPRDHFGVAAKLLLPDR